MISTVKITHGKPHDRLTRIANRMIQALEEDPETAQEPGGIRAVVMLSTDLGGGLALYGYDSPKDGIPDLVAHITAVQRVLAEERS